MKKICLFFALAFSTAALADDIPLFKVDGKGINNSLDVTDFTFMEVRVVDHGKTVNEKFFVGPLPEVGQAVEMVYVGSREDGSMKFQLRVKAP